MRRPFAAILTDVRHLAEELRQLQETCPDPADGIPFGRAAAALEAIPTPPLVRMCDSYLGHPGLHVPVRCEDPDDRRARAEGMLPRCGMPLGQSEQTQRAPRPPARPPGRQATRRTHTNRKRRPEAARGAARGAR